MRLSDLPVIDDRGLRVLLPMTSAVVALESALREGTAPSATPGRTSIPTATGELRVLPAGNPRYLGVQLVSVVAEGLNLGLPRAQGVFVLFDGFTLSPRALVDVIPLSQRRAPAVSAVAVRHLTPQRPLRLVVIGTGPQGYGHVEAVSAIRQVSHVTVVGRDRGRAEQMAEWVAKQGLPSAVVAGSDLPDDLERPLRAADVVVCATTARRPLFTSRWLSPEALVIAMGSRDPEAREVDSALVQRATVVVETRESAMREAGDIMIPFRNLEIGPRTLRGDLVELVTGRVQVEAGRPRLFKSVGEPWEDLVIASAAFDQLVEEAEELR
jgi:ornithine cyclodeaminase/alanine dehydrogenase-like protein (mu-crystallin family)